MLKKILLWVVLPLIVLALGAVAWAYWYISPNPDRVLAFIKKHPNKAALFFQWNNEVLVSQNADTVMPVASTVKTLIAVEFARQAAEGLIKPEEWVDTLELDKFYLADTDGGAHPAWLSQVREKQLIQNGKISLLEIAKGMIRFSSNANTEYLMSRLGLPAINATKDSLGFTTHTPIYPFTSAMMVLQNTQKQEYKNFVERVDLMSENDYFLACDSVHRSLKEIPGFKNQFNPADLDLKVQRIWSNRLPGGSVKEYAGLMQKINNQSILDSAGQLILERIMEQDMDDNEIASLFKRYGSKGGSTAYVLTETVYMTDKQNNTGELAVFFNNLTQLENLKLQASLHEFEIKLFTDETFRKQVIAEINKP